jgi:hypothetical protein
MMRRIALILSFITLATPASADAIDGDWCLASKHLSVKGSEITLPTGTKIQGQNNHHEFLYQVPVGQADAGSLIYLQQQNEEMMTRYQVKNGKAVDGESWMRCAPASTS